MAKYIDVDKIERVRLEDSCYIIEHIKGDEIDCIIDAPIEDVAPIIHAKWEIIDDCERFIAKCSACGRVEDSRLINKYPYCHCGAKIDKE